MSPIDNSLDITKFIKQHVDVIVLLASSRLVVRMGRKGVRSRVCRLQTQTDGLLKYDNSNFELGVKQLHLIRMPLKRKTGKYFYEYWREMFRKPSDRGNIVANELLF